MGGGGGGGRREEESEGDNKSVAETRGGEFVGREVKRLDQYQ